MKQTIKNALNNMNVKKAIAKSTTLITLGGVMATPAFAQFQAATNTLNTVEQVIVGAGVTIMTIAIIIAGCQIAFNGKKITDVGHLIIGGILIGGGPALAALIVAGS